MNNNRNDQSANRDQSTSSALVTGATSGLGYETAIQLAAAGHDPVLITGRTPERAAEAADALAQESGRSVFEPVSLDLGDPRDVAAAAQAITDLTVNENGASLGTVILNAGRVGGASLERTANEEEITFASSLTGHHRLTMALLDAGALASSARIIIAGSEAARGDVPTFNPVQLSDVAKEYNGDLVAAAEGLIRHRTSLKYKPGNVYATTKLFVAWWAAALARRLPSGMTVNAVSPGSAPDTAAVRHANFFMRHIMLPVLKRAPARLGLAATVPVAAARYLDVAGRGPTVTGRFFASAPKKMTGPLHEVTLDHVKDQVQAEAAWSAVVAMTGLDVPSSSGARPVDKRVRG